MSRFLVDAIKSPYPLPCLFQFHLREIFWLSPSAEQATLMASSLMTSQFS
jgi:hypothetical protein